MPHRLTNEDVNLILADYEIEPWSMQPIDPFRKPKPQPVTDVASIEAHFRGLAQARS